MGVARRAALILGVALLLGLAMDQLLGVARVDGTSMERALSPGTLVVMVKVGAPVRGDIVVFNAGQGELIKRVIGVPGDRVTVAAGEVYLDGKLLDESYLPESWRTGLDWNGGKERQMGIGEYFVMGDNRNHSHDSRAFGPVQASGIHGRALLKIWPLDKAGALTPHSEFAARP